MDQLLQQKVQLYGRVLVTHRGADGRIKSFQDLDNVITNTGFAGAASRFNGADGETVFTYIAVGSDGTTPAVTDTALLAEITGNGLARAVATTIERTNTTETNDTARCAITFAVSGVEVVREAALLNWTSGGVMLARRKISDLNLESGDSLTIDWRIQAKAAA